MKLSLRSFLIGVKSSFVVALVYILEFWWHHMKTSNNQNPYKWPNDPIPFSQNYIDHSN